MTKLGDDKYCFACGINNPRGLKLKFDIQGDRISTSFTPDREFQGFRGIVHGGILSLILDECMGNLLWRNGINAVTAELSVRFIRPAAVGKTLYFEGEIISKGKRLITAKASAKNADTQPVAECSGKFMRI
jgi:uncharacterized protein (TIGR00369 family)